MLGLYSRSIFAKPIKMKFVFCCYSLLISAAAFAQSDSSPQNIFIITTDGFRWQEVFTGADSDLISNSSYVEDTVPAQTIILGFNCRTPTDKN